MNNRRLLEKLEQSRTSAIRVGPKTGPGGVITKHESSRESLCIDLLRTSSGKYCALFRGINKQLAYPQTTAQWSEQLHCIKTINLAVIKVDGRDHDDEYALSIKRFGQWVDALRASGASITDLSLDVEMPNDYDAILQIDPVYQLLSYFQNSRIEFICN